MRIFAGSLVLVLLLCTGIPAHSAAAMLVAPAATQVSVPTQMAIHQVRVNATAVAAGDRHTCALTTGGGVMCWGNNEAGALGDGTAVDHRIPVDVSNLTSGVQAVAAGRDYTCALTTAGTVKCWGANQFGQLGDGTTTDRWAPVDVVGLSGGVTSITAGANHTCAVTAAGAVKCWGANDRGQLGNGTTTESKIPADVKGLTNGVAAVAVGYGHTCALTTVGAVKCWGWNDLGQLGDGTMMQSAIPVDVVGLSSGVTSIAAGTYHTCVVMVAGGAKCWGYNQYGQLGDGTDIWRYTPVDVLDHASDIQALAAGEWHTCAVTTGGRVMCWGANDGGQLGDGTAEPHWQPMEVRGITHDVTAIAAGAWHTCAVTTTGAIQCWGSNSSGELGDGTVGNFRAAAEYVTGLTQAVQTVAAGRFTTCALIRGGGVKCWGYNRYGQLGDGTTTTRYTPADVLGLSSGVTAIATGEGHACALTTAGGVKCWGHNRDGQVGDGTAADRWTPVDVVGLTRDVQAITAGYNHTCALMTDGGVKCWGLNMEGQLGDGTQVGRQTPGDVDGLTNGVRSVVAAEFHTCAVTTAGGVKCWGSNGFGQLGDGTNIRRLKPTDVSGLASGVTAVAAGYLFTCAVTTAGGVQCWGGNTWGELGNGTNIDSWTPLAVTDLTAGVSAVAAGWYHACAITLANGVKCWGANDHGQLGDGSTTNRLTPVAVKGVGSGVRSIAPGNFHTCALTLAGGVKCWGWNFLGQLGFNTGWSPVEVSYSAPLPSNPGLFVPYIEQ